MKRVLFMGALAAIALSSCNPQEEMHTEDSHSDFQWQVDRFADIKVLRYQIPSWDDLTPQQRIYAYHLTQAGLAGRDIMWDCNYRHNLEIRRALEAIISSESVDKASDEYADFEV
ncbi:MAG: dihydrofolate reductase, partial [Flavobacteriia bacterium]|nr:dihydrofolate reductase [Flavobacteriia bacterium]